jgi:hypothetical protein
MRRFLNCVKRKFTRKGKNQQPTQPPSKAGTPAQAKPAGQPPAAPQAQPQPGSQAQAPLQPGPTLQIALVNKTSSSNVFCYVTGQAINNNNAVVLLQSDGSTLYFPTSPSSTGTALSANVSIPLGAPGSTKTITIPEIAGGRIWFSVDKTLTFLLNPGPALVEPSVTNQSDPNINVSWAFAELTYSSAQLYANISYVDFVSIPIALSLTNKSGAVSTVQGLPSTGLNTVCSNLQAQSKSDGVAGWGNLIVTYNGNNLRALSPNNGIILHPGDFNGYYDSYVNQVYQQYVSQAFTINADFEASGEVSSSSGQLVLNGESFAKPSTQDIFSSNSGPFTTGGDSLRFQ